MVDEQAVDNVCATVHNRPGNEYRFVIEEMDLLVAHRTFRCFARK